MALNSVTVRVPAKVNLQLSVGPRESNGYHNLVSVFQAVSIYDEVTLTKSHSGSGVTIAVTGDQTHGVPEDSSNLAVKAAQLIGEKFDITSANNSKKGTMIVTGIVPYVDQNTKTYLVFGKPSNMTNNLLAGEFVTVKISK